MIETFYKQARHCYECQYFITIYTPYPGIYGSMKDNFGLDLFNINSAVLINT